MWWGGISDRHNVEKNGPKECTSDFTGAQNIDAWWWMASLLQVDIMWNGMFCLYLVLSLLTSTSKGRTKLGFAHSPFFFSFLYLPLSLFLPFLSLLLSLSLFFFRNCSLCPIYISSCHRLQFLSCFTESLSERWISVLKKKNLRLKYLLLRSAIFTR